MYYDEKKKSTFGLKNSHTQRALRVSSHLIIYHIDLVTSVSADTSPQKCVPPQGVEKYFQQKVVPMNTDKSADN